MEAAETSLISKSAFFRMVTRSERGVLIRKLLVPSMIISSKGWWDLRIFLTARRVASLRLLLRPKRSISLAETQPRLWARDFSRMIGFNASRLLAVSFLESVSWSTQESGFSPRITAPMTNGPAQGPRPTSSIPRMILLSFSFLSWVSFCYYNFFFWLFDGW